MTTGLSLVANKLTSANNGAVLSIGHSDVLAFVPTAIVAEALLESDLSIIANQDLEYLLCSCYRALSVTEGIKIRHNGIIPQPALRPLLSRGGLFVYLAPSGR